MCGCRWVCWYLHAHPLSIARATSCMAPWLAARAGPGLQGSRALSGSPREWVYSHLLSQALSDPLPSLLHCFYLWHLNRSLICFKVQFCLCVLACVGIRRGPSALSPLLPTWFLYPLDNYLSCFLGTLPGLHYVNTRKPDYFYFPSPSLYKW